MAIGRRDFLNIAAGAIVGVTASNSFSFGAELVSPQEQLSAVRAVPLFLSQEAYRGPGHPPTSNLILIARNEWGFDGVELSARMLLEEWGSAELSDEAAGKVLQAIEKGPSNQNTQKPFALVLTIDLASTEKPNEVMEVALAALRRLPIESCSIAVAASEDDDITPERISALAEKIETARKGTKILIENTRVSSGASADRFMESIRKLPGCVGTLIRSDSVQYRFDLAVQDIRLARSGCKGDRLLAIRIKCKTSALTTSEAADFDREVFREMFEKQIAPYMGEMKPSYIAIDSSMSLKIQTSGEGKTSVGSKTFRDMIVLVRKELSSLPK